MYNKPLINTDKHRKNLFKSVLTCDYLLYVFAGSNTMAIEAEYSP